MMNALYSGATGMKTHDAGMSAISNNIANVNTVAYKQQYTVFQDLFSQDLTSGIASETTTNQVGLGSQLGAVRTLFKEGSFEPGSEVTDMAIAGKGYFQVTDENGTYYTRAGNFRIDDEGWLRTPTGMTVTGMPMANGVVSGTEEPIRIDPNSAAFSTNPGKATQNMSVALNVPTKPRDKGENAENPYFNLVQEWNGAVTNGEPYVEGGEYDAAMREGTYANKQTLKIMDAGGKAHEVTLYLDGTGEATGVDAGNTTYEYLLAADPSETLADGDIPTRDTGMFMAGTITFGPDGRISNMTAFTPNGTDNPENRLEKWVPAAIVDGRPQFTATFAGSGAQTVGLDLGVLSETGQWQGAPASAANVGADAALLGGLAGPTRSDRHSVASTDTTGVSVADYKQDGYAEGQYTGMEVTAGGVVRMNYSNAQSEDVYTIPVYRFTSEDGLRREGGNLFVATDDAGEIYRGVPGTNNFGKIQSSQLETSNVDMSREMVSLITMQRGFQMNSKTITTADQLLQKAMEIKRN